jgi:hypothetical protein
MHVHRIGVAFQRVQGSVFRGKALVFQDNWITLLVQWIRFFVFKEYIGAFIGSVLLFKEYKVQFSEVRYWSFWIIGFRYKIRFNVQGTNTTNQASKGYGSFWSIQGLGATGSVLDQVSDSVAFDCYNDVKIHS